MTELAPVLQEKERPYIGAHRGASAYRPENTLASFKKAYELQADFIELDVQLTKDKEVVVFHDFLLDDKTDGKGYLRDCTLSELQELDAGAWFSEEFAGEHIPTLEEVLDWAKEKIWLSIELKQIEHFHEPLAQKVVQLIEHYKMEDQVQIMSFNHRALSEVRGVNKNIITNVISGCQIADPVSYLNNLEAQVYNVPWQFLSKPIIERLHLSGLYVCGSVNDNLSVWEQYQKWEIDVMDTNIPDVMVKKRCRIG